MSRGLNKVMIIGNVGRMPEMRFTPSGKPVTTFSVATNRTWNSADGERRQETEWFNVVSWGPLAEISHQRLEKGQQVYVEGRLQTRKWRDPDNNYHTSVEVVANEVIVLDNQHDAENQDDIDNNETGSLDYDSPY